MEIMSEAPCSMMVVTPHPDDAEGGCGGTMAKWAKSAGTEVVVVLCTNGDKGTADRELAPAELAASREREQQDASDILGVKEVVFLRYPDGTLENNRDFVGRLVREIRRHCPEILFCMDPYRTTSHTHRDHRVSGQTALDAAFSYAWSYLHFPEQITQEGLKPHQVREAFLWGTEDPDVFVEVDGYLQLKSDSLAAHTSQMHNRTPQERLERIQERASRNAESVGLTYAEGFRRVRFDMGSLAWKLLYS